MSQVHHFSIHEGNILVFILLKTGRLHLLTAGTLAV